MGEENSVCLLSGSWQPALAYGFFAGVGIYATVVVFLAIQLLPLLESGGGLTPRAFVFGTLGDFFSLHPGAVSETTPGIDNAGFVPSVAYYAVGILALGTAGYKTASVSSSDDSREATLRGGTIVVGYLPVVIGGLVAIWLLDPSLVSVSPVRVLASGALAAFVYGAVGGYAAAAG